MNGLYGRRSEIAIWRRKSAAIGLLWIAKHGKPPRSAK